LGSPGTVGPGTWCWKDPRRLETEMAMIEFETKGIGSAVIIVLAMALAFAVLMSQPAAAAATGVSAYQATAHSDASDNR